MQTSCAVRLYCKPPQFSGTCCGLQVAIGYSHMLALSVEGRVFSWGHNFYGQLGVGDHKDKNIPQLISYLQEERISKVLAPIL